MKERLQPLFVNLKSKLRITAKDEKGATMVEYALMVVAIALVALVGVQAVGTQLNTTFGTNIKNNITPAG